MKLEDLLELSLKTTDPPVFPKAQEFEHHFQKNGRWKQKEFCSLIIFIFQLQLTFGVMLC